MTKDQALIRLRWMAANRRSETLHHELDAEALDAAAAALASQQALREALEAVVADAVGESSDPLWIVRRELIEAAAALTRASSQEEL